MRKIEAQYEGYGKEKEGMEVWSEREGRKREGRETVDKICDYANNHRVEAVLVHNILFCLSR